MGRVVARTSQLKDSADSLTQTLPNNPLYARPLELPLQKTRPHFPNREACVFARSSQKIPRRPYTKVSPNAPFMRPILPKPTSGVNMFFYIVIAESWELTEPIRCRTNIRARI